MKFYCHLLLQNSNGACEEPAFAFYSRSKELPLSSILIYAVYHYDLLYHYRFKQ
jgi:hypothetical protein